MFYTVVMWPEVQGLMEIDGFRENSYLINDDKGISEFGSSAYFVDVDWLESIERIEMTEERYQYLNSLPIEEYVKEASIKEQDAFCEYQIRNHLDDAVYYQSFDKD